MPVYFGLVKQDVMLHTFYFKEGLNNVKEEKGSEEIG